MSFHRELDVLRQYRHPNVVALHGHAYPDDWAMSVDGLLEFAAALRPAALKAEMSIVVREYGPRNGWALAPPERAAERQELRLAAPLGRRLDARAVRLEPVVALGAQRLRVQTALRDHQVDLQSQHLFQLNSVAS